MVKKGKKDKKGGDLKSILIAFVESWVETKKKEWGKYNLPFDGGIKVVRDGIIKDEIITYFRGTVWIRQANTPSIDLFVIQRDLDHCVWEKLIGLIMYSGIESVYNNVVRDYHGYYETPKQYLQHNRPAHVRPTVTMVDVYPYRDKSDTGLSRNLDKLYNERLIDVNFYAPPTRYAFVATFEAQIDHFFNDSREGFSVNIYPEASNVTTVLVLVEDECDGYSRERVVFPMWRCKLVKASPESSTLAKNSEL